MKKITLIIACCIVATLMAVAAWPQFGGTFVIQKSVDAGDGGQADGRTFVVNGTIGQHLAGITTARQPASNAGCPPANGATIDHHADITTNETWAGDGTVHKVSADITIRPRATLTLAAWAEALKPLLPPPAEASTPANNTSSSNTSGSKTSGRKLTAAQAMAGQNRRFRMHMNTSNAMMNIYKISYNTQANFSGNPWRYW